MRYKDFLQDPQASLQSSPVFVFCGEYQSLFFSEFFRTLKERSVSAVQLDVVGVETAHIYALLQTTFLGQTCLYWCKESDELSERAKKEWYAFCASYQGPHRLVIFSKENTWTAKYSSLTVVPLEHCDKEGYRAWYRFFYATEPHEAFVTRIFAQHKMISLDQACMLMRYQQIVGKSVPEFFEQWVGQLIEPQSSLFHLAQYFFAKDAEKFFQELSKLEKIYPVEFWIAYWSEQLWQALIFITEAKLYGPFEARKKVTRLPFSFMTKDWKTLKEEELAAAYMLLYQADVRMKNSGLCSGLMVFYNLFLLQKKRER